MTADWQSLEASLHAHVKGERLAHTYRVLETARRLAARFGAPEPTVAVAALMHDWAKQMSAAQLLAEGQARGLITDPVEVAAPHLLHGPVAAALLQEQGLVTDPVALESIRWHTTGRPGMGLVEQIVWLADYIEPGRRYEGVESVRRIAERDLTDAILLGLEQSIRFLLERRWPIHLASIQAYNGLLPQKKERDRTNGIR
ncbi:MAG TPA: bis(5'-nucleosyl)-tetraphosphatase (symmetrical) YqeK [Symbiobacteriaceae bacterium]|nr:bis(5'-nucleosyl)-tetraphosphatase (symmetrical) YqeK [Symbiobacteriaceae bacterium]